MQEADGAAAAGERPGPEELQGLFARIAAGEREALGELYAGCSRELYGLALWRTGSPGDAADVVQELFVRLARAREQLAAVRRPLAYLRKMVHRAAVDLHRRSRRSAAQSLETCRLVEADDPRPERQAEARRISQLLLELPAVQREAIYLRHYAGCSFAEIGRATSVPTFTAASRYRLGLRRLRERMGVKP
jgi:RNA polymerase sigma-70 factor (ECF subfamily)